MAWLRQCLHRPLPQQAPDPITSLQYPTHTTAAPASSPRCRGRSGRLAAQGARRKPAGLPDAMAVGGAEGGHRRALWSAAAGTPGTRGAGPPLPLPCTSPSLAFFLALNPDSGWSTFHGGDRRTSSGSEEALARSALLLPLTSPGILSRGHGAPSDSSANSDAVAEGAGAGATPT